MDLCCMKSQSPVLWEFREAHWSNEMCEVTTLLVQLHHLMTLSSSLVIRALCQTLTPAALQWPLPQRLPRVPTSHCHQTHCPDVHVSGWQLEGEPSMESAVATLWRISCVQVCEGIIRKWCRWSHLPQEHRIHWLDILIAKMFLPVLWCWVHEHTSCIIVEYHSPLYAGFTSSANDTAYGNHAVFDWSITTCEYTPLMGQHCFSCCFWWH